MKTIKLKTLALALAFAAGAAAPVSTSIAASWMDDYFDSAGASSNATNPNFFKSQTQNTISLGGFSYRAPMRSTQLFAFSPPGYKAGCGGIDAWLGAYGFVNMDAFVNALRNIGQNAVGYFFQLALKTMAPEIDGLLTELSSKMQQLNQMQINNCQALKTHFSSSTDTRDMDFNQRAQSFGSAITGGFESMFNAVTDTQGSAANANKAMNDACSANAALCVGPDGKPYLKRDTNIAYDAMDETGLYSQSEIELYMSLFGTLVYRQNKTDDTKAAFSVDFLGPLVSWESFLGTKAANSLDLPVYKCPDSQCLLDASTLGVETTNGWTAIVYSTLQKIREKVYTRSYVDDYKAVQLIGMTSVPIYQLISQSMAAAT